MKSRARGLGAAFLWAASLMITLAPAQAARAADAEKLVPPPSKVEMLHEGAPPGVPATSAGGRMTVEKPIVDAGDVVRGKPATAVFEIKNTGSGTLRIISAKPG